MWNSRKFSDDIQKWNWLTIRVWKTLNANLSDDRLLRLLSSALQCSLMHFNSVLTENLIKIREIFYSNYECLISVRLIVKNWLRIKAKPKVWNDFDSCWQHWHHWERCHRVRHHFCRYLCTTYSVLLTLYNRFLKQILILSHFTSLSINWSFILNQCHHNRP